MDTKTVTTERKDIFDRIEDLFQRIDNFFKDRKIRKDVARIKKGLVSDPKLLLETKARYEKSFGVNSYLRTATQWQNLVRVYGIETVCKTEQLTEKEVMNKTIEKFSEKVKAMR